MACRGCGRAWCRCRVDSTDCIRRSGSGAPEDPFRFDVILDDDDAQSVTVTQDGLLLLPPVQVSRSLAFKVRFGAPGQDFDPLVSVLPSPVALRKVVGFQEVVYDTGGLIDLGDGVFTCPRAGAWGIGAAADLLDEDVVFGFGLALNNQFTIAMSGPYQLSVSPTWSIDDLIIHEELAVGDQVQVFIHSNEEGVLVDRVDFWASFIGD